jgi:hypothetical protein
VAALAAPEAPSPAEEHQVGQEALVSLIPALLRQAWPLLDPHNIKGTLPQFTAAVRAIVQHYGRASATAALDYYRHERAAAGVTSRASLKVAPVPADKVIEDAIGWATSNLYGTVTPESEKTTLDALSESVSQLVLDQGRDTIIGNALKDPAAKGWARVTEVGACSFCIMLALRAGAGFLYTSKRSADFQAHDNCHCHAEPVFNAYEPSYRMRQMQMLWAEATKGRSGHDARVAFRQAVEGRTVTGAKGGGPKGAAKGLHGLSKAQVQKQIALTEGLKDSAWRTAQLARLRKQLRTAK